MTGRTYPSLGAFVKEAKAALKRGPAAIILIEDEVEVASTLRHHLDFGFARIVVLMPEEFTLPEDVADKVTRVSHTVDSTASATEALNRIITAAPGIWMYYCFNAEYLFYPFCETRSISEMLAFHEEERREAMLSYVVDLYADDLHHAPLAVSLERAQLDRNGYYALARRDPASGENMDRQLDFYGGLRWRFEEFIPETSRKIDRIALFKTKPGLTLRPDHTLNDAEMNTFACPWHNNLTAAICSFRTAKALKRNPGSAFDIRSFAWHNSTPFEWHSRQLLDLGLMEPGQWF